MTRRRQAIPAIQALLREADDGGVLTSALRNLDRARAELAKARAAHRHAVIAVGDAARDGFSAATLNRLYWSSDVPVRMLAEPLSVSAGEVFQIAGPPAGRVLTPCRGCGEPVEIATPRSRQDLDRATSLTWCDSCAESNERERREYREWVATRTRLEEVAQRRAERMIQSELDSGVRVDATCQWLDPESGESYFVSVEIPSKG